VEETLADLTRRITVLRDMMLDAHARHGLELLERGVGEDDGAAVDAGIETIRSVLAESGERLAIGNDCRVRLSIGLWRRYQDTGNVGDLEEAISVGTEVAGRRWAADERAG
jgi:hypothetical protein